MPLNPLTGQFEDYVNPEANEPLAMRVMGAAPGISASVGMSSRRGANTLLRGGFLDDTTRFATSRGKFGIFAKGATKPTEITRKSFLFGERRFASKAAFGEKTAFFKPSRLNNATLRPRALGRFHSVSVFGAQESNNYYTYAQGHAMFNKTEKFGMGKLRSAAGVNDGEAAMGPGLLASISAGRRMDLRGVGNIENFGMRIKRLATMNNESLITAQNPVTMAQALKMTPLQRGGMTASNYVNMSIDTTYERGMSVIKAGGSGSEGVAGNLLASSMGGKGTQYLGGYFRGALGFSESAGLMGASEAGAKMAVSHLTTSLGTGIAGKKGATYAGEAAAKRILSEGVLDTLGTKGALKALGTSTGARVLGARAAAMAIPGLQFVAAASFVYDLGKMAGEVVKSGINLARDANKSLQGSINKPMFGMGYRDTEAAATSRSRGVMAIQNSRLNARSVLGSEAAMMASHFG